jgi:hypothetical protein
MSKKKGLVGRAKQKIKKYLEKQFTTKESLFYIVGVAFPKGV